MTINKLRIYNYAAAFIDLLGQKDVLGNCTMVPADDDSGNTAFLEVVQKTIGSIHTLHTAFQSYYDIYTNYDEFRSTFPENKREIFDSATKTNIKYQRFSDGLVVYLALASETVKVPMTGIFGLLAACGCLCLGSLVIKSPVRIGLDVAWGAELNDNELYGCVIAKSHNLESQIAQYPRAVLGDNFIQMLNSFHKVEPTDDFESANKNIAGICLDILSMDEDGYYIIDYLGDGFRKYIAASLDSSTFSEAYDYILSQLEKSRADKNSKLGFRYSHLRNYFEKNRDKWIY